MAFCSFDDSAALFDATPVENMFITEYMLRAPGDFVKVRDYIPDIVVELKYATSSNFTGLVVYDFTEPYLRYSTVLKLMDVQAELRELGFRLKIGDSFRPLSAQICFQPLDRHQFPQPGQHRGSDACSTRKARKWKCPPASMISPPSATGTTLTAPMLLPKTRSCFRM